MVNICILGKDDGGQRHVLEAFSKEVKRFRDEFMLVKRVLTYSISYSRPDCRVLESPMRVIIRERWSQKNHTIFAPTEVYTAHTLTHISEVLMILIDYTKEVCDQLAYFKMLEAFPRNVFVGILHCEHDLQKNHNSFLGGVEKFLRGLGFGINLFSMGKKETVSTLIRLF